MVYTVTPWYRTWVKIDLGEIRPPSTKEMESWRKRQITVMQHRRPIRYRLGHGGQLPYVVVLAVRVRACWVQFARLCSVRWGIPRGPAYTSLHIRIPHSMGDKSVSAQWWIGRNVRSGLQTRSTAQCQRLQAWQYKRLFILGILDLIPLLSRSFNFPPALLSGAYYFAFVRHVSVRVSVRSSLTLKLSQKSF